MTVEFTGLNMIITAAGRFFAVAVDDMEADTFCKYLFFIYGGN